MSLYAHQMESVEFLAKRSGAMLALDMGLGKTRCALLAAKQLFDAGKIRCVLVLAPAAVRISWQEEIEKLNNEKLTFNLGLYNPKQQAIYFKTIGEGSLVPIVLVSYSLLPQERHIMTLVTYCEKALLIADESVFLKNRTAKQTRAAIRLGKIAKYRWLLTGTPIANGPLDLYAQGLVMSGGNGNGPLRGFKNWFHFRARYGVMGGYMGKQVVAFQNVQELTKRFAPYVLRRTKKECLDLPEKTYTTREITLTEDSWKVYQDLKREALLALPNEAMRPEPNAAVRLMRLCQLTSGYVGGSEVIMQEETGNAEKPPTTLGGSIRDVSSEKLDWIVEEIINGELASIEALIIWCRFRRERERLQTMLARYGDKVRLHRIFGGQSAGNRSCEVQEFQTRTDLRRVLVGQVRAGGYGLNLTAASTVVYCSNTFSYIDRLQSEDRVHRIGQHNPCLYVDVVATGPKGQRTVDAHVLECLRAKRDVAELTCKEWRSVLEDE